MHTCCKPDQKTLDTSVALGHSLRWHVGRNAWIWQRHRRAIFRRLLLIRRQLEIEVSLVKRSFKNDFRK